MSNNFTNIQNTVDDHNKIKDDRTSSGSAKEVEPRPAPTESGVIREVVEAEPPTEIAPFVQARAETIKLPDDVKKMGVVATNSTPIFKDEQALKLPISDEKIIEGLKQPVSSSFRWFAELMRYLLRQAHLKLMVLKGKEGKVIRQPIRE